KQRQAVFGRVSRDNVNGHVLARRLDQGDDTAIIVDHQQTRHLHTPRRYAAPATLAAGHVRILTTAIFTALTSATALPFGKPQPYRRLQFRHSTRSRWPKASHT